MAVQSFCYVGAFLMSYGWGLVNFALLSASGGNGNYFALQVINFFFYPAQGFLNALVYLRPNYLRWREAGDSRLVAIQHALFSLQAPRRRRQVKQPPPHHPLPPQQRQKPVDHHHDITDSTNTEVEGGRQRKDSLPKEGEDDGEDDNDESSTSAGGDAGGQD
jgi:hypothetical protein